MKVLKSPNPTYTYLRLDKFSNILNNITINQEGGVKPPRINITNKKILEDKQEHETKEFIISFNKINYTFHTYHDDNLVFYRLYQTKDKDIPDQECIHIIIDKSEHSCEIHNISYDSKCMPHAEMKDKKRWFTNENSLKINIKNKR
jgi:hypothetical protein